MKKLLLFILIILGLFSTGCTKYYFLPNTAYPAYDDVYVPLASVKLAGVNDPDFNVFNGTTRAYEFQNNVLASQDEVFFTFQMPHTYSLLTPFKAHLHYSPDSNNQGDANFSLLCSLSDIGQYFQVYTTSQNFSMEANSMNKHLLTDFPINYTCRQVSCVMQCQLTRESAASGDTYSSGVYVHAIDYHILQDTAGSKLIYPK